MVLLMIPYYEYCSLMISSLAKLIVISGQFLKLSVIIGAFVRLHKLLPVRRLLKTTVAYRLKST